MQELLAVLFILSTIVLIIGMFKPNVVLKFMNKEKRNRKNVLLVFGLVMVVLFLLLGLTL